MSQKPKEFEQSFLDTRFAIYECTLTASHYGDENPQFVKFFYI